MSTRKRSKRDRTTSKSSHEAPSTSPAKEKEQPGALSDSPGHVIQSDLPPSRPRKEILRSVSPPGLMVPLRYFIYTLVTIALLSAGWYTYITAVGLKHWKEEVGWWGVTVGRIGRKQDKIQWRGQEVKGELEWHLSQLASALGIPATDVASALNPFVPPATLSSLAPQATGEAMKVLFEESHQKVGGGGTMGNVAEGLGTVVGFDDPLEGGS
ncbi:uncharacterized protein EDB91DRAFT_177455 [Suillus paluster]|uniref:uncharacterized protein n=1 Tax=Suillus paluster TaxID=48578 RepID=UPI001B86FB55|nr:uncharacterized protein EDB91DRAFT_177455 [Suillus paluster]KAG1745117.1 hypothetical protein EDB91DRAFT_177455 [Suillus paluster]